MAFIDTIGSPKRTDKLKRQLRDGFEPGGKLLWSGFPRQGFLFRPADIFLDMARRGRTIYAVTDRHVIVLTDFFGHNVRSLRLRGLTEINLSKKSDRRGTITFGPANSGSDWARGWPGTGRNASPAFEGIARAQDVLKIIRDAQSAARS